MYECIDVHQHLSASCISRYYIWYKLEGVVVNVDDSVVLGFAPPEILIIGHFLLVRCMISSLPAT